MLRYRWISCGICSQNYTNYNHNCKSVFCSYYICILQLLYRCSAAIYYIGVLQLLYRCSAAIISVFCSYYIGILQLLYRYSAAIITFTGKCQSFLDYNWVIVIIIFLERNFSLRCMIINYSYQWYTLMVTTCRRGAEVRKFVRMILQTIFIFICMKNTIYIYDL